jgi:pilus assembly protein CpaB
MRLVTIGSLGASAALGLGALIVARMLLPANTGQVQAAPRIFVSPMVNAASVVVAAGDIPFGKRLDGGDLKVIQVPRNAAPAGAFSTVNQVLAQDHGGAPVTLFPISAREPLLPAKLSGPGARASVAAELAPGMRAYAISVTDATSVGGHALPGDRVDVVLMRDLTGSSPRKVLESEVVIQNVRLLGVGLNADPTSNKPETAATATLEVSVRDAQKLAMAGQLGALSLALRPTGLAEIEATSPVSSGGFGGGGGDRPARGHAARGGASGAAPGHITVVEGDGAPSPKTAPAA